jgi:hypothetical protein
MGAGRFWSRLSPDEVHKVEADLLTDRGRDPNHDWMLLWDEMGPRRRRKWLRRLTRSERRRNLFEGYLSKPPDFLARWRQEPITAQREALASIDYLRYLPLRVNARIVATGLKKAWSSGAETDR